MIIILEEGTAKFAAYPSETTIMSNWVGCC